MSSLHDLPTPSAVIDLDRLERNTHRMSTRAHQLGVRLRPHVKTHKTLEGATYQIRDHFGGITVSTLAEAEFYAHHGVRDITYAVPITPSKIERALELSTMVEQLNVLVDQAEVVTVLAQRCALRQRRLKVLIKIDCGYGRAGLTVNDPQLLELARQITSDPWLEFAGILTHAGHAYDCAHVEEIKAVASQEYTSIVAARDLLQDHGLHVPTVSLGSTPTATVFESLDGVTEMRPGNYALFDLFQASIGSCELSDIALSVITEVIAYYPERGDLLIDAGALALSKDEGPSHLGHHCGYGLLCSLDYQPLSQLSLIGLSQEHGKIKASADFDFQTIKVGSRLRVLPNHSCLVTALYDRLHVARAEAVFDVWTPVRGW